MAYVDSIKIIIKNKKTPTITKYLCILLLKDASETKNQKFMNYVSEKILKRLKDFAKLTKKPIDDRIKSLSNDLNVKFASLFWQLLLECIK